MSHKPQLATYCGKCGNIAFLVHLKDGLCLQCQAPVEGAVWDAYSFLLLDRDCWRVRALEAEKMLAERIPK